MALEGESSVVSLDAREPIGRSRELAHVLELLDAPARLPAAIQLVGDPGIGKSTIWATGVAAAAARGYLCLTSRPTEAEATLAFAGLGDVLGDAWPAVEADLPGPQRRAIRAALLLDEDELVPDARIVGVAVLSSLRALSARQPVLLAIDDEQWLDPASRSILGFALRRLHDEAIAVLVARRPVGGQRTDLLADSRLPTTRIDVAGLSLGALHAIVVDRFGTVLTRPRLRRLHELSGGSPFLALELVRAVGTGRLDLDSGDAAAVDVDGLLGARLDALPPATRTLLFAAAATSRPTLDVLTHVSGADAAAALAPAVDAGIVVVAGIDVRFTHPLLAAAAYAGASPDERRTVRSLLAGVVDDPVERTRHRALAASDPDEQLAADVERAAESLFQRGAPGTAAGLARLAAALTPPTDADAVRRRTAIHAEYLFESGDTAAAAALLEPLIEGAPPGTERARLLALAARIRHFGDDVERGTALNERALVDASADDLLSAGLHEGLAWGKFLMREDIAAAADHADRAVAAAERAGDDVALGEALAIRAVTALGLGRRDDASLARAMALEPAFASIRVLRHPSYAKAYALACMDELDEARALFAALLARADEHGDESALPSILVQLSMIEIALGAWADADEHARAGDELAEQSRQHPAQAALRGRRALLAALRGDLDQAEALGAEAVALAGGGTDAGGDAGRDASGDARSGVEAARRAFARGGEMGTWALGASALARGQFERARQHLMPLAAVLLGSGLREPGELRFLPDLVEALLGAGALDQADTLVADMEAMAVATVRPTAVGVAARCRAQVLAARGQLEAALAAAEAAVAALAGSPLPMEAARARLVLGEVQRRLQQRRAARETIDAAIVAFDALGAVGWAARARDEQARIGGRSGSNGALTPTEDRIVRLVADGLANKEVASAMGVTTKTVELHLSHVYAKLGVGSRTELVRLVLEPGKP